MKRNAIKQKFTINVFFKENSGNKTFIRFYKYADKINNFVDKLFVKYPDIAGVTVSY